MVQSYRGMLKLFNLHIKMMIFKEATTTATDFSLTGLADVSSVWKLQNWTSVLIFLLLFPKSMSEPNPNLYRPPAWIQTFSSVGTFDSKASFDSIKPFPVSEHEPITSVHQKPHVLIISRPHTDSSSVEEPYRLSLDEFPPSPRNRQIQTLCHPQLWEGPVSSLDFWLSLYSLPQYYPVNSCQLKGMNFSPRVTNLELKLLF